MSLTSSPEDWLPADLVEATMLPMSHRDELYHLACRIARQFRVKNIDVEDCIHWMVEVSSMRFVYEARQFEYNLRRAAHWVYQEFDPDKVGGVPPEQFVAELQGLYDRVEAVEKLKDKRYILALIQHAINVGHNPVDCSSRQLAAVAGIKSYPKANDAMNRMQVSMAGGVIKKHTYDGVFGHSRSWLLDTDWGKEGYTYIMHDICVPLKSVEEQFHCWVSGSPAGTSFTVTGVSARLNISRGKAKKLLDAGLDEFFGGSFYAGDNKIRKPAMWWREHPKPIVEHPKAVDWVRPPSLKERMDQWLKERDAREGQ